jgi:flagellar hook-associated protein 3 FlgL
MMQNTQLLQNLRNNNRDIIDWQNKLATGQRIHRPGDDPVGIGYLMRYNSELNRSSEFLENAQTGLGYLNTMDELMQQSSDVLKRARVLVQQAANGTMPDDNRKQVALEIQQLKEQLVMIGNSTFAGRYLFNGQKTDVPPYSKTSPHLDQTDAGVIFMNVSPSVSVPISLTGEQIFGQAGTANNVFQVFDDILAHLNGNQPDELAKDLEKIDQCADRISNCWAEIGARTNRLELVENRIEDQIITLQKLRAEVGSVDTAEVIIQLQQKENVLQASISVGARIMQVSLVDYLR